MFRYGGHEKKRKRRKQKSEFVEGISLFLPRKSLEGLQASTRAVEEERANCEGRRSRECIGYLCVNDFHR